MSGTVTWWDTSDATTEAPTFKALVADFQAQHPKIKVNYVNVPFSDAQQKFKTAAQGGNGAPDVLRSDVGWTPGFAESGYLLPLDGTPAVDKPDDILAGPAGGTKYNGKTYGAPQVTDTLGLLYNKELFAKAGITEPPATWAEVKTAAQALRSKAGADGIYLNPDSYFLLPFLYGEGATLADAATKKITVSSAEAVRAVDIAKDLVASGAAAKPAFTDGYANMQAAFKDGKVAMIINGPWAAGDTYSGKAFTSKDTLGVAAVPAGSTGKAGAPVGGHNLVIYAGTEAPAAAQLFVQFMTSGETQATVAEKNGTLPARTSAYTAAVTANPVIAQFQKVMDTARPRLAIPQASDLFTPLSQSYVKILQGQDTQAGLNAAADEFTKVLPGYTR
ncbi:sugar ABC transporter substrate-binding protein [Winogradskya humida]|uniref:Sugar ABC transporter substrate-binding protein n=1 Tax=Winogradskya humida TaxID=113566 RepID=A0ABQ4A7L1_9ACTN|nr:sugar ABC transporter substrate-binding protein [Actinoplanes humidus]